MSSYSHIARKNTGIRSSYSHFSRKNTEKRSSYSLNSKMSICVLLIIKAVKERQIFQSKTILAIEALLISGNAAYATCHLFTHIHEQGVV